jgi:hypothetical protein
VSDFSWLGAVIAVPSGVLVAIGEMYVLDRKIPFLFGGGPARSATWLALSAAFICNAFYAAPLAHFFFSPVDARQYFLAALAAVEALGGHKGIQLRRKNSSGATTR